MSKRTSQDVRKAVLQVLLDGKVHVYGDIERKTGTNWESVRHHCKDLELFGAVTISEEGVVITKNGRDIFKKL